MCGRFFRHDVSWPEYRDALSLQPPESIGAPEAAYNIAPTQHVPIIRYVPEGDGDVSQLELAPAMWGLVPSWWNKPLSEKKFSTINARSETAATSRAYRGAFRHHHCLIPASGFYEWQGKAGEKQPYAIGLRNRRWFCFAGLWDRVMIDGSELDTFTILTTKANASFSELHSRMPVILHPDHYPNWLDATNKDVGHLFAPYPAEDMHWWKIGKAVGNVRNQGPELIEEI